MKFDLTVSIGNIISIAATLVGVFVAAWQIGFRINRMEMRLNLVWDWFKREHEISNGEKEE